MLSHDTRLRCDLVDLYYTLYGTRRPVCLPIPELAGIMNLHRHDMKRIKSFPPMPKIPSSSSSGIVEVKRSTSPMHTVGPTDIIMDNLECVNVEIASKDVRVKVNYNICLLFVNNARSLHISTPLAIERVAQDGYPGV